MANTINLLSYANTYGDWMVTTNQLVQENNNFSSGIYNKNLGTLYLNDPTLGLQVTSNAVVQGQFSVTGVGSGAYIQNDLRLGGQLILTNTSNGIISSGAIHANGPNNGIVVSNNMVVGNTIFASNINVAGVDLSTYIDNNSAGLRANDYATLMVADFHIEQVNSAILANIASHLSTSTATIQDLIDANTATAYVKGIVVGSGGFSVGGSGSSNTISLDGTTISNSAITFAYNGGARANASLIKNRTGGGAAYNAELRWNEATLTWEVRDVVGTGTYSKIISSDLLSDSLTSTSSSTVATSKAANSLYTIVQSISSAGGNFSTSAYAAANTAAANTVYLQTINNTQNTNITAVNTFAGAAFAQANSANNVASSAYGVANNGLSTAFAAFNAANNALDLWVRGQANTAVNIAQGSFNYANTLGIYATSAYNRSNTSANLISGTTGSAEPNNGRMSFTSDNGVTIVGSGNTLNISTPQDVRTVASPTFNNLTLTNALAIGQGGTGGTSQPQALTNLLPTGATAGYVLTTNGPGSYFWAQSGASSSGVGAGSTVASTRLQYTANGNITNYTTPTYAPGSNQLRVYFDGVRQYDGYTETSNTTVSFTTKPANTVQILFEVDAYVIIPNYANLVSYTTNSVIGSGANTVQLALDALIANVAFKGNTTLAGSPQAPTAANLTANGMIATTLYVQNVLGSGNTFAHSITGNANTVSNGVYITASYANPSWITSIANTKIAGNIISTQITSVANTQITGNITSSQIAPTAVTPGVYGNTNSLVTFTVDQQGRITSAANLTPNIANTQIFGVIRATQLANTTVTPGIYGSSNTFVNVNVDQQGRVTAISNVAAVIPTTQLSGTIANTQLAATSVGIGTYGGATKHAVFTVDQQGRMTFAANVDPSIANTQITGLITNSQIASIDGSKVTGTISASGVANTGISGLIRASQLENTAVTAGNYGNASIVPRFTVDAQGRITNATNVSIQIANTQITGNIIASQLQPTGVVATTYGSSTLHTTFTVDQQGRITSALSVTPSIANTLITGLITDSQIATVSASKVTGQLTAGQIVSIANTQITGLINAGQINTLATTQLTGTVSTAQLGTTNNPQFSSIGVGVAATGANSSINLAQNSYLRVGNTYISSGGDYAHISTNAWYNGSGWTAAAAIPHVLYQMSGNNAIWYRGSASLNPTYVAAMSLNTGSGDLTVSGNVTGYGTVSDFRMKENIVKLDGAMDKVSAINGYYFNYKSDENKSRLVGVIAQEVEQVLPELVYEFSHIDSEEVTKAVRYEHLTAVLVEAIKELKQEIKDLKQEVDVLKGNNK